MFIIPNIIHTLDSFVVKIKGPGVSESIVDEFKAIRQPNIGMQEFHKGAWRELVGTFNHDFPGLGNVNPHYRSKEALCCLLSESIKANSLIFTSLGFEPS